jgi:hypothetical protein
MAPLLERSEGIVDQAVQGHAACLGHYRFEGGLPVSGTLGEHLDDAKEEQLPFGAEDRVKTSARGVKPWEGPKEALNRIGRRGQAHTAHATDQLRQLLLDPADPCGNTSRRRLLLQPRQPSPNRALILRLQHLLHHGLAGANRRRRREMLRQPAGHAVRVMTATQDVCCAWHQGGIGLSPSGDDHVRPLPEPAQLPAEPATGPVAPRRQ